MKILILGAEGNLGSQLVKVFAGQSNEIIPWDRGEIDITDRELILKKVEDLKPHVIINAAAYNAVDKCEDNEDEYELAKKINIDGPKFLAEAALKFGAILVHFSTDYVFAGDKREGYSENDDPAPISKYGKTKFHGEKRLLELSGNGLKWYLIRTSKLFGPVGENSLAKISFFDLMLKLSKEKDELEVVNEEVSCFTYTTDLAQATKKLVISNYGYGIYHLVNAFPATWYQAVVELFKIKNISIRVRPIASDKFSRPAKRPKYSVLLNTKFEPLRDWREALREYLNS